MIKQKKNEISINEKKNHYLVQISLKKKKKHSNDEKEEKPLQILKKIQIKNSK